MVSHGTWIHPKIVSHPQIIHLAWCVGLCVPIFPWPNFYFFEKVVACDSSKVEWVQGLKVVFSNKRENIWSTWKPTQDQPQLLTPTTLIAINDLRSVWMGDFHGNSPSSFLWKVACFKQYNFNLLNIKWVQPLPLQKELTQFEWVHYLYSFEKGQTSTDTHSNQQSAKNLVPQKSCATPKLELQNLVQF